MSVCLAGSNMVCAMDNAELILVLGMHRSGTSAVTRALPCLGVDIGNVHLARYDNPKGFFEEPAFVHINETIFDALAVTWDGLESMDFRRLAVAAPDVAQRARLFLRIFCADGRRGLKDPRLCRLLPFWSSLFALEKIRSKAIIALRSPASVSASLMKRDGLSRERACALWIVYMCEALLASRNMPRIVVSYERLLRAPRNELTRLAHYLGLPLIDKELRSFTEHFLDPSFCHHSHGNGTANCGGTEEAQCAEALYQALLPFQVAYAGDELAKSRMERMCVALLGRFRKQSVLT